MCTFTAVSIYMFIFITLSSTNSSYAGCSKFKEFENVVLNLPEDINF